MQLHTVFSGRVITHYQLKVEELTKQRDEAIEVLRELVEISDDLNDTWEQYHDGYVPYKTSQLQALITKAKDLIHSLEIK